MLRFKVLARASTNDPPSIEKKTPQSIIEPATLGIELDTKQSTLFTSIACATDTTNDYLSSVIPLRVLIKGAKARKDVMRHSVIKKVDRDDH